MEVTHSEVGKIFGLVWMIILSRNIRITGKSDYMVFIISYLNKRRVEGVRGVIYSYPYLKHFIKWWTGCWGGQLGMMNEAVGW